MGNARCIYPGCDGQVYLVDAPDREKPILKYVGECSVGGKQHTYEVDPNSVGYRRSFDWSKKENNINK